MVCLTENELDAREYVGGLDTPCRWCGHPVASHEPYGEGGCHETGCHCAKVVLPLTGGFWAVVFGKPVAQGRGRAARWRSKDGREGITVRDPKASRSWKGRAVVVFEESLRRLGKRPPLFAEGPVELQVMAWYQCPKSDERKREPRPARWHTKRGDLDNIVKAVKDAGTGILYRDDSQVAGIEAVKMIAPQGAVARVEVGARLLVEADGG